MGKVRCSFKVFKSLNLIQFRTNLINVLTRSKHCEAVPNIYHIVEIALVLAKFDRDICSCYHVLAKAELSEL